MKKLIILLISLMVTVSCVAPKDFRELRQRVDSMQKENQQSREKLQKQIRDISDKLVQIQERTEKTVSSSTNAVRNKQADLWSEIREQREKLAKLQGEQDLLQSTARELKNSTGNNTQYLQDMKKKQERMAKQLNLITSQLNIHMPSENASQTTTSEQTAGRGEQQQVKIKPESLYNRALNKFNNREYEKAKSLWAEFIEDFPEHELIPNAYFWQGECFFQMQDYSNAILKYQEVVENYSDSNKYPPALLKQGISFYKKDKPKPGRILLKDLMENFPDTSEAKRAEKFLQKN